MIMEHRAGLHIGASSSSPWRQQSRLVVRGSAVACFGCISAEPLQWVAAVRFANGTLRPGHWSYAVAWDGQAGLTIRYSEDLLQMLPEQDKAS